MGCDVVVAESDIGESYIGLEEGSSVEVATVGGRRVGVDASGSPSVALEEVGDEVRVRLLVAGSEGLGVIVLTVVGDDIAASAAIVGFNVD